MKLRSERTPCGAAAHFVRAVAVVTVLAASGSLGCPDAAAAQQCGATVSECRTCHETRGERPVVAGPLPWHVDHAFADFCSRCHGGDPTAPTATAAHVGVSSPLGDVRARCVPCHGTDADGYARRYRAFASTARPASGPPPDHRASPRRAVSWRNVALATAALVIAVGGLAGVARHERRRRATAMPEDAS